MTASGDTVLEVVVTSQRAALRSAIDVEKTPHDDAEQTPTISAIPLLWQRPYNLLNATATGV